MMKSGDVIISIAILNAEQVLESALFFDHIIENINSKKASMVWGETLPSGRERAIETLIDMEPQGSFYRAARVLVSVVDVVHKSRTPRDEQ